MGLPVVEFVGERNTRAGTPRVVGIGAVVLALSCSVRGEQPPSLTFLGTGSGGAPGSRVRALSWDGSVAGGDTTPTSGVGQAMTWTAAGGRSDWGPTGSVCWGLSGGGGTAVGTLMTSVTFQQGFRYRGPGTYTPLAPFGAYPKSAAYGVNGDGTVIVGRSSAGDFDLSSQATRWTEGGGVQGLGWTQATGVMSEARAVSRDGQTIVGWSEDINGRDDAFIWRPQSGLLALPEPGGNPAISTRALGLSGDATFVVGLVVQASGSQPMLWDNQEPVVLPIPSPLTKGTAYGVSDSGATIVGYFSANGFFDEEAALWINRQPRRLADVLASVGVAIPMGWRLSEATSISADGLTIGGFARDASNRTMGFVAVIPAPGSSVGAILVLCLAGRRRRR